MALDDISDFVGEAADMLDLLPEKDSKKERRRSSSIGYWVLLTLAVVAVFWMVFSL